jgi:hypothetical protein
MTSINNVLVMDNRETPLEFVGRKKVPKGISSGTGFNGVPTEQQKYYIYKNYVEPALLLKNQREESEVVKAIKEALGVKTTVVKNSSIVNSFGFEDEGAQQKVKKEKDNITKKLVNDAKIAKEEQVKQKASKTLQAFVRSKIDANDLQPAIYKELKEIQENQRAQARGVLDTIGKNKENQRAQARGVLDTIGKNSAKKKKKSKEEELAAQTLQSVVRRVKPNQKFASAPRTLDGNLKRTYFNSRGGAKSNETSIPFNMTELFNSM